LLGRRPLKLVLLEAENDLALHQTGHNSGVIHSGLYYKPGSLKAQNCTRGREMLYRFCREQGIRHERCGKVVVATAEHELPALQELYRRGVANGLEGIRELTADQLREYEPHVAGIAGLFVPQTGIVDYREVAHAYGRLIVERGGEVRTEARLRKCSPRPDGFVLHTTAGEFSCRNLLNCAGLQSDRVARLCGVEPGVQIIPFRGEYYEIVPGRQHLVRNLIYPVPDPRFPFLGVHFTRMVKGGIEAGPNAVLALRREGYGWGDVSLRDLAEMVFYPGFWRMAWKYGGTGLAEVRRSLSKRAFVKSLQRLVPEVQPEDVHPAGSGVRAQAVDRDGKLVDDFRLLEAGRMIHVINAPSPAATASLSIGETVAELALRRFSLPSSGGGSLCA
jgi:L-2-hydroxyglutarate oxidase